MIVLRVIEFIEFIESVGFIECIESLESLELKEFLEFSEVKDFLEFELSLQVVWIFLNLVLIQEYSKVALIAAKLIKKQVFILKFENLIAKFNF